MIADRPPQPGDRCECRLFAGVARRANAAGRLVECERWVYREGRVLRVEETMAIVWIDAEPRARFVPLRCISAVWRPVAERARKVRP